MKNILVSILGFILTFGAMLVGLQACDHEAARNEIKNHQWVQDSKDGKPYTNYGE